IWAIIRKSDVADNSAIVATRIEEGLPLSRHLLENLLRRGVWRASAPGTAKLLRLIIASHSTQDIFPGARVRCRVNDDLGKARRHRNRHFDIEANLAIATAGTSGKAIYQHILQRHVRQIGHALIDEDVIGIVTIELQQTKGLACPGKRNTG